MYLEHKKRWVSTLNVHSLGLLTACVLSPRAGLWLRNVSYLPRLQLGACNVPLRMERARSVSPFW